jgi:uncharacterized protein (DUF433 family)
MPEKLSIIHSDPDILGGTPVFVGTRVPVKTLLDYLEAGEALDVFLDHFPSVSHEQAVTALELAKDRQRERSHLREPNRHHRTTRCPPRGNTAAATLVRS